MRIFIFTACTVALWSVSPGTSVTAQTSAASIWPKAKSSVDEDAITFAQAKPHLKALHEFDEEPFKSGPTDSNIRGRLFYLGAVGVHTKNYIIRHFNVLQADRPTSSAIPQASTASIWPKAQDSMREDAITFAQAKPDLTELDEGDEEPFKSGPTDSNIRGRLFYLGAVGVHTKNYIIRHFNVLQADRPIAPMWFVAGGFNWQKSRGGDLLRLSFWPDGHGIDMMGGQGGFPGPPYPYMAPMRYDFDSGRVSATPDVSKPIRPSELMLDGPHAWSRTHRFIAYWFKRQHETRDEAPVAALAIGSTESKDKLVGLPVEPSPQMANAAWTNRDTLLYDYSKEIASKRSGWYSGYEVEGFDRSRDYSRVQNKSGTRELTPSHWWPSIYEVDPLPFRTLKSAQGRVLIHNAFAPIPSPDGRFIAFCGWGRDTPVPAPKPGEKAEVEPSEPRWWVWERTTKKRTLISEKPAFNEQVKWTPDSRAVVFTPLSSLKTTGTIEIKGDNNPAGMARIEAEQDVPILRLDVASLVESKLTLTSATSELGRIRARAIEYLDYNDLYYNTVVRMRGLTRDGKYVLVDVREWENRTDAKKPEVTYSVRVDTIHALRLSDKSDQTAVKLERSPAYDWFDTSQPAP